MISVTVENIPTVKTDFSQEFKEIGDYMLDSVRLNFIRGGRPDRWAPLKVPMRKGRGGFLGLTVGGSHGAASFLFKSGALLRSVNMTSDRESATVSAGRGLRYAFAHQFGYAPRNLPARPYMVFQEEDIDWIQQKMLGSLITFEKTQQSTNTRAA